MRKALTKAIALATLIGVLVGLQVLPLESNVRVLAQADGAVVQTTVEQFSGCGMDNGASVTNVDGGEVRLPALVEDYFDQTSLDTDVWIEPDGSVTVADGLLTINASSIRSVASVGDADLPAAVEGRIRFADPSGGTGWADFGLGKPTEIPDPPNVLFITDAETNLYANDYQPGTSEPWRALITDLDLNAFHNVRFELYAERVDYYVDGDLEVSHPLTTPMTTPLHLWFYSQFAGFDATADWMRVARYPTSDQFTSCPVERGITTDWTNLAWEGDLPAGTSVRFETRSSVGGQAYSDWEPLQDGGAISSPDGRYLQYRITLNTSDPTLSPQVDEVSLFGRSHFDYVLVLPFVFRVEEDAGRALAHKTNRSPALKPTWGAPHPLVR